MKAAVEQVFNGSLNEVVFGGAYDPTRINAGRHTGQYNLGSGPVDKFIGPCPVGIGNFGQSSLAIPSAFIHPIKINDDLYWVFGADQATAAATRRVQLWEWTPSTNIYNFVGAINLTFPTATNHTVRGIRVVLENYSVGTVAVSGTAVTGTGTTFTTQCVGSHIGFGSTDPNQITTWFRISAIGSATGLTLANSAGTIAAGTPYVIRDLMIIQATTNATATNGGFFVTKGLNYSDFSNPATNIPAATTVDRIKATYWLRDAATITNTVAGGCALGDFDNWTQQYVYVINGAASSLQIYRYNMRAPLASLTGGAQNLTGTDIVITGAQTVTGTISQNNNGRVATLTHGPGSGIPSLYMFTSTRILRIPLSSITAGNVTFVADQMTEVPPGGTETNISTGAFTAFDISQVLDKLFIVGAASTGTFYITDYYTGGQQIDRRTGSLTLQTPSALRNSNSPPFIHTVAANIPFVWLEDGWLFYCYSQAATANLSAFSVHPLGADWEYLNEAPNRIICPVITLGATPAKFYRVATNIVSNLGDSSFGISTDAVRIQYRTSGISDNSGSWVDVPPDGDLSGVSTSSEIQFGFLFRTAGPLMLPSRVLSLALIYETNDALPSQYQWNFADFNISNGTFAWVQASLFGTTPGIHTINIFRADTNALVLTQASSSSTNGTFENWNGSAWVLGLGADTVGRRRRFVPTGSLPSGVDLYATITVA